MTVLPDLQITKEVATSTSHGGTAAQLLDSHPCSAYSHRFRSTGDWQLCIAAGQRAEDAYDKTGPGGNRAGQAGFPKGQSLLQVAICQSQRNLQKL